MCDTAQERVEPCFRCGQSAELPYEARQGHGERHAVR
jgi:hypothetical protein